MKFCAYIWEVRMKNTETFSPLEIHNCKKKGEKKIKTLWWRNVRKTSCRFFQTSLNICRVSIVKLKYVNKMCAKRLRSPKARILTFVKSSDGLENATNIRNVLISIINFDVSEKKCQTREFHRTKRVVLENLRILWRNKEIWKMG